MDKQNENCSNSCANQKHQTYLDEYHNDRFNAFCTKRSCNGKFPPSDMNIEKPAVVPIMTSVQAKLVLVDTVFANFDSKHSEFRGVFRHELLWQIADIGGLENY